MFDIISYLLGKKKGETEGEGNVTLDGSGYTFTDTGGGAIVITPSEEVNNNG